MNPLTLYTCDDTGDAWLTCLSWVEFFLRTPGLAGMCLSSVNAFTVSPTLPGDVCSFESSK